MTHLNKLLFILICMSLWLAFPIYGQATREHILLDNHWKFTLGHATDPSKDLYYRVYNDFSKTLSKGINFSSIDYDDSSWQTVDLPHDWAVTLPFSEKGDWSHGYKALGNAFPERSIGWYRKTFDLSKAEAGKRIELQFDGIFRDSRCWVNGIYVGQHLSGYTGVKYDITDLVHFGKPNVITVRVDATQNEGWFYEGAGIYRHVWLNSYSPVHSSPDEVFIYTKSIGKQAEMHAEATVYNRDTSSQTFQVEWTVLNREKKVIATHQSANATFAPNEKLTVKSNFNIPNAQLWDTEHPYLYTLITKITANGKTTDLIHTRFGVRIFSYKPDGFYLNNKKMKIKGVCVHQDHAGVGTALLDELQYYRVGLLKAMGANAYRTAHHPHSPVVLQACDSLGLLVMDETRLLNSGREYRQQFEDLIKRDRNHASVFMWCIGNEEEKIQSTETGERIARTLVSLQQHLDPSRVSTYGANVGNESEGVSAAIPVRGFNYNLYGLTDYEKEHPNQPIIGTEVASTVGTRGVYLPEIELDKAGGYSGHFVADTLRAYLIDQDKSYPSWASQAQQWYSTTANDSRFMGGFVWTGFDYRGEPTPFAWPNISSHFGVMDVCGFPKNVYYYYKAQWGEMPVLHIAPHWNLNQPQGTVVKVWVYGNTEEVELFLNGKSLGKQKTPTFGHLYWDVPYEKGTLKAVGTKNGKRVTTEVTTTENPFAIMLSPHKTKLKAGKQDAVVVNVSVVDKKGREVPDAQNLIQFELIGDATIAGVGNGDPSSHEKDTFAEGERVERKLFNGKCQVIIRSGEKGGKLQLRATAKGLKEAQIIVKSEK